MACEIQLATNAAFDVVGDTGRSESKPRRTKAAFAAAFDLKRQCPVTPTRQAFIAMSTADNKS